MMEQEKDFEQAPRDASRFYPGYTGDHGANTFASHHGAKISPTDSRLVPPIGERLFLGLISVVLWSGMLFFEVFYLGLLPNAYASGLGPAFMVFSMGLVTVCLVLINVVFCRIGWFWLKRHQE